MQIAMLGPLEVRAPDSTAVEVGGSRVRTLLIALALEPGRVVSMTRLIDAIWGDEPPQRAVNALQALASRLRRALPDTAIAAHPSGYRLVIDPEDVDVTRFERLVAAGRASLDHDPATAARTLLDALTLWRGPALLEVADAKAFEAPVARLNELRIVALEDRIEADLRLGRGAELTTELTSLVAEYPLRERMAGALMRALSAAGRPAEALSAYENTRAALAEALGTDPSPELSALHTAVLRGELGTSVERIATGTVHSEDRPRTNLRATASSFVGRDHDVEQVGDLISRYRLATLTGPGGFGKTRLSTEVGRTLVDRHPDGVWLVEFARITDGAEVPQSVLGALGLREQALTGWTAGDDPADRLVGALTTQHALLVLDNCEHVIGAVAELVDRLLGECPFLRILATSREPLGITGEAVWPVEPLARPPDDADPAAATSYAAIQLLADRADAVRPGFTVTQHNLAAVVRICRALDGMPLAIELAAARLRTMTVEQLADGLADRFRLLTKGSRVALPRHQTLRSVVDWSWDMLSAEERALLRRLAMFSGGATLEAAETVCADPPVSRERVFDLLISLTDKSLLMIEGDDTPRYRMLETIKAYSLERLDQAGERDPIRRKHAQYYTELAETADPHLRRAEQLIWRRLLAAEHDNLTGALRAAIASGDAQAAVRLVGAAGWYWWLSGRKVEGIELAEAALDLPGEVDETSLAAACAIAVLFTTAGVGDERQAAKWFDKVAELHARADLRHPLLRFMGVANEMIRSAAEGKVPRMDAIDELLTDDDPWVSAMARLNRARMLFNIGHRLADAEADARAALVALRDVGERWGLSFALTALADLIAQRGDLGAALAYYEEAIVVVTELGTVEDVLFMRGKQVQLRWLLGDADGSEAALAEAEREAVRVAWPDALAGLAHAKAELARWKGEVAAARAHLSEAEIALRHVDVHSVFRAMLFDTKAYVCAMESDLHAAGVTRAEALSLALKSAHAPTISQVLVGVADLAVRKGLPGEAAALLAAGEAIRGAADQFSPDAARVATAARDALGDEGFDAAAQRGADVTIATAAELAAHTFEA